MQFLLQLTPPHTQKNMQTRAHVRTRTQPPLTLLLPPLSRPTQKPAAPSPAPRLGMSHAAIIQAVCYEEKQLGFGPGTPEGIRLLAEACMSRHPEERPSFADVLDVLEPLGAALAAQMQADG